MAMKTPLGTNQETKVSSLTAHLPIAEKWKGTVPMATKELLVIAGQNRALQSLRKNVEPTGNSSGFIFDVSLSTAIAADGRSEAKAPVPKGPLSPDVLDKMNRYWRAANYLCFASR